MEEKKIPEELKKLIRGSSMLAYLWNRDDAYEGVTRKENRFATHGCDLKGEFISCLVGYRVLPAGTEGWVFRSADIYYSDYVRIGDEDYPAQGAEIYETGASYTFVTTVTLESGNVVIADSYANIVHPTKRLIGKVGEKK